MTARTATVTRRTRETSVTCRVDLDSAGPGDIRTGIGFLDHMLGALACHAGISMSLQCEGDLAVDDHHTAEDCAIVLGEALDRALADRAAIVRFGSAYAPLDESLARSVIDLVRRPCAVIDLGLTRERLGDLSCENIPHFFTSLAINARLTLHVDVLRGSNDHHRAEAAFKSLALALRQAIAPRAAGDTSTKGSL
jgi:imidazoleglycerol phosphate dehydratase HisB